MSHFCWVYCKIIIQIVTHFSVLPSGDRKPKIDLLKTCVNCIPRLLPYEMSRTELIELLARVSLNVDEEIRMMAQQTMVNLIIESPAYRQRTIQG